MKLAIRVDTGTIIGYGHVNRCLTIALALKKYHNVESYFVMRRHYGNNIEKIRALGFSVEDFSLDFMPDYRSGSYLPWIGANVEEDANAFLQTLQKWKFGSGDCVLVDHYGIDQVWEEAVVFFGGKIGAIDDLANRPHKVDFLIDQTLGRVHEDYNGLHRSSIA